MHSVVRTDSQISCHTCEWAMSQMWMSHVTCVNDYHVTCHNIWMIHVTHSMETRGQPQAASPRASTVLFWLYVGGCSSFSVGHDLFICVRCIRTGIYCVVLLICGVCFIETWHMTQSDVGHDSCICVRCIRTGIYCVVLVMCGVCLIQMWHVTRSYVCIEF